jgi:hypothetical protein
VTHYAPLRFLVLWTAAVMVAAALASSAAHAVALGNAAAHSTLGQPLRVAIPLETAPGELIAADCFGLVRPTGDGPVGIVTAKVSLERAAAIPRLVVTTREAINEPAIRLAVHGGCEGVARRDYVLLLDPSHAETAYGPAVASAGTNAPQVRESRQEMTAAALAAAARRDSPESSGTGARRVAQRPVGEASLRTLPAGIGSGARVQMLVAPSSLRSGLMQIAATADKVRVAPPLPRAGASAVDGTTDTWWTVAVAVGGLIAVILGAILVRHGRSMPTAPEWSHHFTRSGPRSVTSLSKEPVTLSPGASRDSSEPRHAMVTLPNLTIRSKARSISPPVLRTVPKPASQSRARDPSPDALLDDIEADLIELRAVRETRVAARADKQDLGGNAILQAIEDAERDLMLDTPPADAAMDRSLEDDLRLPKRGPKKAAA